MKISLTLGFCPITELDSSFWPDLAQNPGYCYYYYYYILLIDLGIWPTRFNTPFNEYAL